MNVEGVEIKPAEFLRSPTAMAAGLTFWAGFTFVVTGWGGPNLLEIGMGLVVSYAGLMLMFYWAVANDSRSRTPGETE